MPGTASLYAVPSPLKVPEGSQEGVGSPAAVAPVSADAPAPSVAGEAAAEVAAAVVEAVAAPPVGCNQAREGGQRQEGRLSVVGSGGRGTRLPAAPVCRHPSSGHCSYGPRLPSPRQRGPDSQARGTEAGQRQRSPQPAAGPSAGSGGEAWREGEMPVAQARHV